MASHKSAPRRSVLKVLKPKPLYRSSVNHRTCAHEHDKCDFKKFSENALGLPSDLNMPACPYPDKTYCSLTSFLTTNKVTPAKLLQNFKNLMNRNSISFVENKQSPWTLNCTFTEEPTSFLVNLFRGGWFEGIRDSYVVEMHFCEGEFKSFQRLTKTVRLKLELIFVHEELQGQGFETKSNKIADFKLLNKCRQPLKNINFDPKIHYHEHISTFLRNLESPFNDVKKYALKVMLADIKEFRTLLSSKSVDGIINIVHTHTKENIDFSIRETAGKVISLLQSY